MKLSKTATNSTKMFIHCKQNRTCKLIFLLVVLVVVKWDSLGFVSAAAGETRWCIDREREALLRFKQGLIDDLGYLSSWGSEDNKKECCDWYGVYCSNTTGQVTYLDFYYCNLRGNISSDLLELHHLNYLDMTGNQFGGSIPAFIGSMKSLTDLRFMENNFTGIIPHQLGNLTNLSVLTLNYNFLVHKIPKSFVNLTNLQILYININHLGEPLADFFGKLSCKSLERIDISLNNYTGPIPDLGACSELVMLKLHHNKLTGLVPASLGQLSKLEDIDASYNSLQGTVSEALFSKLPNLYLLDFSFNLLTFNFTPDWVPPFRLQRLTLGSCKIGPSFPRWLRTQTNISSLDLSNAGISDQLPNWLWSLSSEVRFFNISHNQISGTIPPRLSSNFFGIIDVSYNNFSGPLPLLHPNVTVAQFGQNMFTGSISFICQVFSSQLEFLDLSDNQLEGALPTNCWNHTIGLKSLNLNNNNFYGEIPHGFGSLRSLETLHLRSNNLSGQLPPTLRNCRNLILIDVGGNKLTGDIPRWLAEELTNMSHLSFRQNRFHGGIPTEICHLTRIQMLDLSGNDISGEIPPCFDNFTSLVHKGGAITPIGYDHIVYDDISLVHKGGAITPIGYGHMKVRWKGEDQEFQQSLQFLKLIDLSSNRLTGSIPKAFSSLKGLISLNLSTNRLTGRIDVDIGQMEMLETLDLSNNQFSGEIPIGLAKLNFLGVLDLAFNNLTGQIPRGTQLQGFNASAYSGNEGLWGPPLPLCPNTSGQGENVEKKNGGLLGEFIQQQLYIPVVFGFIVGFWGVVGSLVLNRSLRNAYFGFIDDVADWFYDSVTIFFAKLRQALPKPKSLAWMQHDVSASISR